MALTVEQFMAKYVSLLPTPITNTTTYSWRILDTDLPNEWYVTKPNVINKLYADSNNRVWTFNLSWSASISLSTLTVTRKLLQSEIFDPNQNQIYIAAQLDATTKANIAQANAIAAIPTFGSGSNQICRGNDGRLGTISVLTPSGAVAATSSLHAPIADVDDLATLRMMMAAGTYPQQVRLKCHTSPGIGGGVYTRRSVGGYVDDDGATIVDANWAYVLPDDQIDLRAWGPDITGEAPCDDEIASYLACVEARDLGVFSWGEGNYRITQTVIFNAQSMFGLRVEGAGERPAGYGSGGTRLIWAGDTATDDVLASEQPYQTFRGFEIYALANARTGIRWQTGSVPVVGAMTRLLVTDCRFTGNGKLVDSVAACPDAGHQSENNHDHLTMTRCTSTGFTHADLANYNTTGQAKAWVMYLCNSTAQSDNGTYACYMASGSCSRNECNAHLCQYEARPAVADAVRLEGGGSEFTHGAYYAGFSTASSPITLSGRRVALESSAWPTRIATDSAPGPRVWIGNLFECVSGDGGLLQAYFSCGQKPQAVTLIGDVFPNTDPTYFHSAHRGTFPRVKINLIGCYGRGPADYTNPAAGAEAQSRLLRSNQSVESPWIIPATDPQCRAFFTAGPRVIPTDTNVALVRQWISDSPLAQPMTRAAGSLAYAGIELFTRTGGIQVDCSDSAYLSTPGDGRMNPSGQSFLVAAVVRLESITTEQCVLGKCDFGGVTDNNWQCLVDAAGHLQLAWGNDTGNRYTASSAAVANAEVDYLLMWGLDRATSEVVYVVMVEDNNTPVVVERHAITITAEVFSNTLSVFAGCNTANALPAGAHFTHWSMYILDRNTDPFDDATLLSDRYVKCIGEQLVREFSL